MSDDLKPAVSLQIINIRDDGMLCRALCHICDLGINDDCGLFMALHSGRCALGAALPDCTALISYFWGSLHIADSTSRC